MNLVLAQVAEELEHAGLSSPTHLPEPNRPTHQSGQTASDVPPAHCPVRRGPVLRIGATQLDPPSQGSVVTRGKLQSDRCFSPHEGSEADWVALHMPDGGKVRVPLASHCTVGDVVRAAWTAQTGRGYANDDLLVEGTRMQVDGQTIRLGDLLTFTNTAIPWRCVSLLKGSGKRTAAESLDQGGTRVRGRLATRICEAHRTESVEEGGAPGCTDAPQAPAPGEDHPAAPVVPVLHAIPMYMVDAKLKGTFNLGSWNLNSLVNLASVTDASNARVWGLQETRHTDSMSRRMGKCPQGTLIFGEPRPVYVAPGQKKINENTGRHGGVAVLLTPGYKGGNLSASCEDDVLKAAYKDGRWMKTWIATDVGKLGFILYNFYAPPGNKLNKAEAGYLPALLEATLQDALQYRNEPVVIMGDFNMEKLNCPLALAAMANGDWWEVGEADNPPDRPTCLQGENRHRLDWCLLNRAACGAYRGHIYAIQGNVWPHLATIISFDWGDACQTVRTWDRPKPLTCPETWKTADLEAAQVEADTLMFSFLSKSPNNAQEMWDEWRSSVETWWGKATPTHKSQKGRGQHLHITPRTTRLTPADGMGEDNHLREMAKRSARLTEMAYHPYLDDYKTRQRLAKLRGVGRRSLPDNITELRVFAKEEAKQSRLNLRNARTHR